MIIGHKKQIGYLNKILENKEAMPTGRQAMPHSFLFVGPEKVGKKTIALEFIKSIQCEKSVKIGELCGKCLGCEQIGRVSADFFMVEPERDENGSAKEISIAKIRALKTFLADRPATNKFKVAIINDAHLMTHEAQNALLKSLEEPKGDKILFLITSSPENLLGTILSRAYMMKFNLVAKEDIKEIIEPDFRGDGNPSVPRQNDLVGLAARADDKDSIYSILKITDFRPGVVFDCLADKGVLEEYNKIIDDFFTFAGADLNERFKYVEKKAKSDDFNVKALLDNWTAILRLALFQKTQSYGLIEGSEFKKRLSNFSDKKNVADIADALKLAQEISFLAGATNVNKRLAMEILAISL